MKGEKVIQTNFVDILINPTQRNITVVIVHTDLETKNQMKALFFFLKPTDSIWDPIKYKVMLLDTCTESDLAEANGMALGSSEMMMTKYTCRRV